MTTFALAVAAATVAWFIAAAALFFNPFVDKIYRSEESHAAVRTLPQSPSTIGKILSAVVLQCVLWAWAYTMLKPALMGTLVANGVTFGTLIVLVKIVPRDVDRLLLTTYPGKRMTIEFIVGIVCAYIVGFAFAWLL